MSHYISSLTFAAFLALTSIAAAGVPRGQASGTFPPEPFNGMQVTYAISGAQVTKSEDAPGFTWRRTLQGILGNGELRVTGRATMTSGYGYSLRVSVTAGSKSDSATFEKKVNESSDFDLAVPIYNTAASGSISISMTGNYNAGTRGVVVYAALSEMAPVVQDTKPVPPKLSETVRLKMILDRFVAGTKPGNFGAGWMNNIASWLPYTSRFDSSICGNYQANTLAILDAIRWSEDPKVRSLMEGFDYGPIQSLYGGHQAVVIYPKGKDWMTEGIVLDPWIEQKAKTYAAPEWAGLYSFGAGTYHGIGGSKVYEGSPAYPTVGGAYTDPKAKTLTDAEKAWMKSLPQSERDRVKAISDVNLQNMVIKNGYKNRKLTGIMVVNCPVKASVKNSSGRVTGFTATGFANETTAASFDRVTKSPGSWMTMIRFDPTAGIDAVLNATGDGPVEIVVLHGLGEEKRTTFRYTVTAKKGQQILLDVSQPGAKLRLTSGGSVAPSALNATASRPAAEVLFDSTNIAAVLSGPKTLLWLTFNQDTQITEIFTYHWNDGRGTQGGTISLIEKTSGRTVGTWTATCTPGMNNVPNVNWTVKPNLLLPKGTYRVAVSAPETWSYNTQSQNAGIIKISGYSIDTKEKM